MENQTINQILNVFEDIRMEPTSLDQYETVGKPILIDKLSPYVSTNDPIEFVMLGFPFKSTNERDKVLGKLPDMGEQATLENFTNFSNKIRAVYAPGLNITIVSDGFIFNRILGVPDSIVEEYKEVTLDMAKTAQTPLTLYDLDDFYSGRDRDVKRDKVLNHFGISPEQIQKDILFNPDVQMLYRGMIRFMEEELADKPYDSNNQRHKKAKALVREMMANNEAYSHLTRIEFPNHIKISMHPSVNNGAKYSIKLIPGKNTHHSAWHSSLVVNSQTGELSTMHKIDALNAGYHLVNKDGRPYYFETN